MIKIEERITSKVPGLTSFFIISNYNPELVKIISTLDCKNYSKKTKEWEIPSNELAQLLDLLCEIDDININFIPYKPKNYIKPKLIQNYKTKPFNYQLEGIEYGLTHNKFLLLDKMGTGKTLQSIYIAEELKQSKQIEHCLILCGINSLKANWKKEIKIHSQYDCVILGEKQQKNGKIINTSIANRIKQLLQPINEFFIITNIESLRDNDFLECLHNGPNKIDMIIVDELHSCKNPDTKQGKNLLNLKSDYQIGLSGTLLINNPLDLYLPLNWIDMDRSTLTNFKSNYCIFNINKQLIGYKNLDIIKNQLAECSIRRTNVLDLPPKTIIPEYLDMKEDQNSFYEDVKDGIRDEVDKVKLTTTSLLAMATRLRQSTSLPSILTSNDISNIKIERTCELVDEIIKNDDKVVIFSSYKDVIKELESKLNNYNVVTGTGDTNDNILSNNIDKFQNDPNTKVFLGTWQRCGTGLTLTAASYMIFIDTPWTDAQFQQSCDRIYRIGTTKPVFIYVLICNNTIDERVYEIINTKRAISDYIIDDTITQEGLNSLKKYIEDLK